MVYRVYTEKRDGMSPAAGSLLGEINTFLGIKSVKGLRLINRYDVEGISREMFEKCVPTVFLEPQADEGFYSLPDGADAVFGVEYLPGQYDQRADSAAQCIQIITMAERPTVRSAKIYMLYGDITAEELVRIKKYLINAVESRECSLDTCDTLETPYDVPADVATLNGFCDADEAKLRSMVNDYALAMDYDDIVCCRDYFRSEHRDPTLTEIRMIDTYWSDHCRHTTFNTVIDKVNICDSTVEESYKRYLAVRAEIGRKKPVTLMDIATIGAKYLKKKGFLQKTDDSEEINACTVRVDVDSTAGNEEYLVLFKNETHNHPTEIEPFGGAATCIGGAIRDPLSGRGYVYQAMRVTGAGDPLRSVEKTIPGKLPQKKLVTTAASGYSSYGNQIGLATGLVDEIYHEGYTAKRLEVGAVIGAVPRKNVYRDTPCEGDIVILLGGKTGRDGCGGATGSSKSHTAKSLELCGAEVQKGNAPEERKLQRLFRNAEASRMIKRCNDFGAGGVSVAIGELADGLEINLDAVPKKYEGLDGTELAISESQERMAVVLDRNDVERFVSIASGENLEATVVATVTKEARLKMFWRGKKIVDVSRKFLDTNGAQKHIELSVSGSDSYTTRTYKSFSRGMNNMAENLNVCSGQGLAERFDSTIGAGSVLMPFGGKNQSTPTQVMAAKIPVLGGETDRCSVMAYGADPFRSESNCYDGGYGAVLESVAKLVCSGARPVGYGENCYFSFQEYFERLGKDATKWGKPFSALLGALDAQLELGIAAIGGKDSMSGTFENISVPPTLISFAVSFANVQEIITPEFKSAGNEVVLLTPSMFTSDENESANVKLFRYVEKLIEDKKCVSACTPTFGGIAATVMKMCMGNSLGFSYDGGISTDEIFEESYARFVLEVTEPISVGKKLGVITCEPAISMGDESVALADLTKKYEDKLETVFPQRTPEPKITVPKLSYTCSDRVRNIFVTSKPKVVIPVFPGTNCEYDSARAFEYAGAEAQTIVISNISVAALTDSVKAMKDAIDSAQIVFIPGGFSGGDEPDGSGKFITAFFRNPEIKDAVTQLLNVRGGLMGGICNGFQALIKLGLVPFGRITDVDASCPTLTFNNIGRHVSRLVTTRVASNKSPWYSGYEVGETHTMPVSHGEGRFVCDDALFASLASNGQIATQYIDPNGDPTMNIRYNPNGSMNAVEGITSPDGRVFGKMGHSERFGNMLYKNVPGTDDRKLFVNAVRFFKAK